MKERIEEWPRTKQQTSAASTGARIRWKAKTSPRRAWGSLHAGEVGKEKQPEAPVRQRGKFYWVTWEGTRNHPRAREHKMDNALVEQRGKFYYVYDNEGSMVVRKMVGSNGTIFCPAVK